MSKKTQVLTILLAAVIAFVCGFGGSLAALAYNNRIQSNETAASGYAIKSENGEPVSISLDSDNEITVAEAIAAKVMPSVVGISTTITTTYQSYGGFGFFFGFGGGDTYSQDSTAVGTGVIVDSSGYILTNSHVINDGNCKSVVVSLYDGTDTEAEILWNDSNLDLAVIKIEGDGLTAAELGDSDTVNIGAYAAAIGNPLGLDFERSMSQGIISGLDRTITVSTDSYGSNSTTMEGLMQTDATINSGNSGGPLLNSRGQVIAINSAKASSGEGMGFAIPINVAKPIIEQIKETGTFNRLYLGIRGIGLEEQTQYSNSQLEEQFGTTKGVYVSSVSAGGGAEKAGLKEGDIILKLNGTSVNTINKINSLLTSKKAGDTVTLTVMRDKEEIIVDVELTTGDSIQN